MKKLFKMTQIFLIICVLFSCLDQPQETTPSQKNGETSTFNIKPTYQNELFKEVTVEKIGTDTYRVKGKGQNSISTFAYVVEDGHNQILKGFASFDNVNSEWGSFNFTFEAKLKDKNTTLILALFEKNLKYRNKNFILTIPLNK